MLPKDMATVVQALQEIQKRHDWTLSTLSRKMGLSTSHISMILSGRRHPGFKFMRAAMCAFPEIRMLVAEHIVALSREPVPTRGRLSRERSTPAKPSACEPGRS